MNYSFSTDIQDNHMKNRVSVWNENGGDTQPIVGLWVDKFVLDRVKASGS